MKQVFTGTIAPLGGGWNGEDIAPFVVFSDTNPLAGASTFKMPTAGTIRNLHVKLSTAFGAGTSGTFTFAKGGTPQSLSVTIADSDTEGSDTSNSVTVSENDEITITATRSGSTSDATLWFSFEFETTTANESVYACSGDLTGFRVAGTAYNTPLGGSVWENDLAQKGFGCSAPGTFTAYSVLMTHAPGSGESWTFHLMLDGVAQDGTSGTPDTELVIADTATNGTATFELFVVAHEKVAIRAVASATAAAQWSTNAVLLFESDSPFGAQHLAAAEIASPVSAGTSYAHPLGGGRTGLAFDATDSNRLLIGGETPLQISGWTIRLADAPDHSLTFVARLNGADTGLTATFASTDTEKTVTVATPIEIGAGDTWSVKLVHADGIANTAAPDWTWVAAAPISRNWFLTGQGHTATGSNGVIAGKSGTVVGDQVVPLSLKASTAKTYTGNNAFVVAADTFEFDGLPTSNPGVAGQLWNDGGTVKVSAG